MIDAGRLAFLEAELNQFDAPRRSAALTELLRMADAGEIPLNPKQDVCNMHCHTFFSFNAYGHSPTSLAWLGKRNGYRWMGTVDFDVLDAVDEFLDAAVLAGVKGSAGIETRVFVPEFASREINSPGEPGILYHMGIGFTSSRAPGEAAPILAGLRQRAVRRNQNVVSRVNAYLSPVKIEYENDVLPLTPAGTATERHIVVAYIQAAGRHFTDPASFWAEKLQLTLEQVRALMQDSPKFQNQIRAKLMKRGGAGYVEPAPENFPTVDEVHSLVLACGALPCAAWLDGTSAVEQEYGEMLELLMGKGAVALNIIPDRSWNIPDPKMKTVKLQKMYEVVDLARQLDLPLNIGTEMNSFGNRLMDDFNAPELAPILPDFLDGANFIYGHTALQRAKGLGYESEWAKDCLPSRKERNRFYTRIGAKLPAGKEGITLLDPVNAVMAPEKIMRLVSGS
jgi:hypothetical protein